MQIESVFRVTQVPDVKALVLVAHERAKAFGARVVRPVRALGTRLSAVIRQPWFFPAQVAVVFGLLWLHQDGYLQVPVTVCDWVRLGK